MAGEGKLRSDWNRALLMDVIGPSYAELIRQASQRVGHGDDYFSLWPDKLPPEPWRIVVEQLYQMLYSMEVRLS